ncbi:MAG: hypothetical protein R3C49_22195 [Planctomycetaceae bacterium]
MKSIFQKELRDIVRWLPLGLLLNGLLCWQNIPGDLYRCSNHSAELAFSLLIGSSLFAVALALLQTLFDLRPEARGFLLHRPIPVADIFKGKLLAGWIVHTLAWLIPVGLAAVYLESIGPERLPVTWTDMLQPAICCLISFLFYPAGVWMACRDARWVGTKCLPLVLPSFAVLISLSLEGVTALNSMSMQGIVGLLGSLTVLVLLTVLVWKGARHAFVHQTFLPSPSSDEAWSWSNVIGLTVAATMGISVAMAFIAVSLPQQTSDSHVEHRFALSDGRLWEVEETWPVPRVWNVQPLSRRGRRIQGDQAASFQALPADWTEQPFAMLYGFESYTGSESRRFQWFSQTASKSNGDAVSLFSRSGRLYVYGHSGLLAVATPQGIYGSRETPQGAFEGLVQLSTAVSSGGLQTMTVGGNRLIADRHGVYQINFDAGEVRKLSDVPAQMLTLLQPTNSQPEAFLWAVNGHQLRRFRVQPVNENQPLPSADSELVKATYSYPLSDVNLIAAGEWELPNFDTSVARTWQVASLPDEGVLIVSNRDSKSWEYEYLSVNGSVTETGRRAITRTAPIDSVAPYLMPPALIALYLAVATVAVNGVPVDTLPAWGIALLITHVVLAVAMMLVMLRRRRVSAGKMVGWICAALCLGVGGCLGLFAVWPKALTEACSGCSRQRRLDSDRCEHCGAAREPFEPDGPQLIGPRQHLASAIAD